MADKTTPTPVLPASAGGAELSADELAGRDAPAHRAANDDTQDRVDGGSADTREALDFDDDEIYSGRGNNARRGGTYDAEGADSGRLAPPSEQLSPTNGPQERQQR
jgi:hypothetical protein